MLWRQLLKRILSSCWKYWTHWLFHHLLLLMQRLIHYSPYWVNRRYLVHSCAWYNTDIIQIFWWGGESRVALSNFVFEWFYFKSWWFQKIIINMEKVWSISHTTCIFKATTYILPILAKIWNSLWDIIKVVDHDIRFAHWIFWARENFRWGSKAFRSLHVYLLQNFIFFFLCRFLIILFNFFNETPWIVL